MKIKLHALSEGNRRRIKIKLNTRPFEIKNKRTTKQKLQTYIPSHATRTNFLSPPSTRELGSTASVYEQYGLTTEKATVTGIRALDYVKIESPQFVERCEEIPSNLQNMISHFDLIWVLSVESSYAEKRRWNEFIAFREFLQNSLDAMHESVGYENIKVDIAVDNLGTWVMDKGKGLDHTAFLLGGKDKACYLRGRYGEGLKVAALWFASRNHEVYIFTRDNVFKCFYPEAGLLTVVFGKNKKYVDGTWVLIKDYQVPSEDVRKLYYKLGDFYEDFRYDTAYTDCPYKMPNLILEPGDSLYVRDIFVNNMSKLFGTPSYYSYNLWWVDLEPNRVQVQSTWELQKEMAGLLINTPGIVDITKKCIVTKEYGGIPYYLIEPKYYELKLSFPTPSSNISEMIASELEEIYGITAYSIPGDLDGVAATAHEGGKCILAPDNMTKLFAGVKSAADFVINKKQEILDGAIKKDERSLSQYSRGALQAWRLIAAHIVPGIEIVVISGRRAFYQNKTIYLTVDNIEYMTTSTFIHELSHAHGEVLYGEATDLSEHFEDALAKVGSGIYGLMGDMQMSNAIQRAEAGAIYARWQTPSEFFALELYDYYKKNPGALESELSYPSMFILIADSKIIKTVRTITADEKPAEEYYYTRREEELENFKKFILELFADRDKEQILNISARCKELYFPEDLAYYIRDKASQVEIFSYDLKGDLYAFRERLNY